MVAYSVRGIPARVDRQWPGPDLRGEGAGGPGPRPLPAKSGLGSGGATPERARSNDPAQELSSSALFCAMVD